MATIGSRLREERMKFNLTQVELADIGGIHKNTQGNYENDQKSPDAKYLERIAILGIDILYIITGVRSVQSDMSAEERNLIENYRAMNDAARLNIQAVGDSFAQSNPNRNVGNK
ncbi:helix-turn-helix domain-containing protein [Photorhabdus antumapuensis]|uniref:helix-turn-helix domain-containing protein n=1 Tax=Photorhabdus antumapuensis TaxID=2862867 RepID=UPI001CEDFEF1|nr:helix-turn-helix transcriptional regulator [Photorhabdus antumapuensis]MCA6220043.1 helix-turn-helix domain-containing protein [Photorhabdus antumapuensis]